MAVDTGTQKPRISAHTRALVLVYQRNEVTEAEVYRLIAASTKNEHNREVLERIARQESTHASRWREYTGVDLGPKRTKVLLYRLAAHVFGFTFAVRLMEKGESSAQEEYRKLVDEIPEALDIFNDEVCHEEELIEMLDEERLSYVGSMVLGLNDAMVEMSGSLAGFTFAMQNTRLIALAGLITGIAATLSMASSEYLSTKSEHRDRPFKAAAYTGLTYLAVVAVLLLPFLLFPDERFLAALGTMVAVMLVVLAAFNFYISVAQGLSFRKRFLQMAGISLGVAALSFVLGLLARNFLGIDI